jgi:molybdopterin-guanine dinucleotide biosynthesis protein A
MQLAQVKNSTDSASQSLKDFTKSLKLGNDSPYSLRDQEATAQSALQPFLDQIAAGQSIDQAKYQDAAKAFLDVERQLFGSTQGYFDALDKIQSATNTAISAIDNAVPITPAVADPFTKATAAAVQTGNEMTQDTNALLQQVNQLLSQIAANTGAVGASAYFSANRSFAA